MSQATRIAVIDIGKTNAKVTLFDLEQGREVLVHTTPNRVLAGPPYPHFDVEALWAFIITALGELHREGGVDAISITAHGATAALIDAAGDLALPVLDYEHAGPDDLAAEYDAVRPPFSETGSPRLPMGLNIGSQLFWQQAIFKGDFDRMATILPYPQYWAFRLTGVRAGEVTSWGCHSDLWAPTKADFSSLVDRMGWRRKMPPLHRADDVLGTVLPEIAAATGLPPQTPVHCGLHDSNASLLPHLWQSTPPFSVVSTGTWVVVMAIGGEPVELDEARDTLINVNAQGDPVPSARFMGGRAFQLLAPDPKAEILPQDRAKVLAEEIMFLPSLPQGSGPFPHSAGRWTVEAEGLTPGARLLAVSWYLALMTATCLDLVGAKGDIVVEGPFSMNPDYFEMLAAATRRRVRTSGNGTTGTSLGAAGLVRADKLPLGIGTKVHPCSPSPEMVAYAAIWRGRTG
ncbi:FGGY-family carbohydrate kinase [Rhizobiaceae bacterium n13]|uniref:FGGY-family carbohydrate kinase n=1 Tax=Ferirhizobium litorale TaxID=2927786 RepID=A0AAE3QFV2_9HYPH|nr:FGGY-family carbohydrate kinase [Fererhizobium litorale]MDI7863370.1 FGGY-family carbohydrate kinase [Fererhizobium litorale]MDI7922353.1 FGGY-family carbohydrate kinase [Fererhizobium litorale]